MSANGARPGPASDPLEPASFRGVRTALALILLAALASCMRASPPPPDPAAMARSEIARGELAYARGDLDAAERAFAEALAAQPEDARALAGMTRVLIDRTDFEAAIEVDERARAASERVAADEPDAAPVAWALTERERCRLLRRAAAARIASDRTDAIALLDAVAARPACPQRDIPGLRAAAWVVLAQREQADSNTGTAVAAYREALALDPSRLDLYLEVARLLRASRDREATVEFVGAALERHPGNEELRAIMLDALGANGFGVGTPQ